MRRLLSRRALLRFLATMVLSLPALRRAPGQPSDRGIGGTGFRPNEDQPSDRGIGGTGVIGTIRKFGSIVVNDLRISYASDADVRIDGRPASLADLRIGQVVRVAAHGADGTYSTRAIDVTSEVVGPVERTGRQMVVLGQSVSTVAAKVPKVTVGDVVAVSGLRRNDGTIVASLIERRPGAPSRVAGPVDIAADGSPAIGRLALAGISTELIGRRALIEGEMDGDRFVVRRGIADSTSLGGVRALSLETYVERRGDAVSLGSGYAVSGAESLAFPAGRSTSAIITATLGGDGRLVVDSVRTGGRTYGTPSVGGPGGASAPGGRGGGSGGGPAGGSGGRTPMDFGHDKRGLGGASPGDGASGGQGGSGPGGAGPGGGLPGGGGGPGGAPGGFGGGGPGGRR